MARSAFPLRLPEATRSALESLSRIERRPINQLVTEAVEVYLRHSRPEERGLAASLEALRRYRERDPGYRLAMASFVDSEASVEIDPVEGTVVSVEGGEGPVAILNG